MFRFRETCPIKEKVHPKMGNHMFITTWEWVNDKIWIIVKLSPLLDTLDFMVNYRRQTNRQRDVLEWSMGKIKDKVMVNIFWCPVEDYDCFEFNRQFRETCAHNEKTAAIHLLPSAILFWLRC